VSLYDKKASNMNRASSLAEPGLNIPTICILLLFAGKDICYTGKELTISP